MVNVDYFRFQPKPIEVQVISHHMQRYAVWFGGSMLASTVSYFILYENYTHGSPRKDVTRISYVRVATAQGIWLLTFPDRENTGNLVNLIFYTGKIVSTQGKFKIF